MESFLNRYRNITVLLLVIFGQLVLLGMQVKNVQDVRVIRVWAVTAVTPVARVLEFLRGGSVGVVRNYILMRDATDENRRLKTELGRLKLENVFLKNELSTADRAKALQLFQTQTPSKTLAANVIGTGAGSGSKVVFVNRGSAEGVLRGMGVVTPDGIVGKVIASYPTASEVLLVTDPDFAAGVISQRNQVRGTLKGQGTPMCKMDYVPSEEKVEVGETIFTSGDDRIFPRGFPVGVVKVVRPGQPFKEILIEPSGVQHGVDDLLILIQGVHQPIPEAPPPNQPVYIAAPPPASASQPADGQQTAPTGTDADKLRTIYKSVGEAQGHNYGEGPPGSKPPDFTKLPAIGGQMPAGPASPGAKPATGPATPGAKPAAPPTAPAGQAAPGTKPVAGPATPGAKPTAAPTAPNGQATPGTKPVAGPATPGAKPTVPAGQAVPGAKPATGTASGGTAAQDTKAAPGAAPRTSEPAGEKAPAPKSPATKAPPKKETVPKKSDETPDAVRRGNQAAGAPAGTVRQ